MQNKKNPSTQLTKADIIRLRLINQQISGTKFKTPEDLLSWMMAVQSQEFAMAKWALGLRLNGAGDSTILKAFNEGKILRTHVLRPTWHFVTPEDIRWLLALTGPRVNAFNASMYRKMELDHTIFKRSNSIITKALQEKKYLTRNMIKSLLERKKIFTDTIRLSCLMMYAELDQMICSGPLEGKQFTYALMDERAPLTKKFDRDQALAALCTRYFTTRGPATIKDLAWWSGLTTKEVNEGVAMLSSQFNRAMCGGQEYIFKLSQLENINKPFSQKQKSRTTFLMPDYDEYGISYKDRSAIFNHTPGMREIGRGNNIIFNHVVVIDGVVSGAWSRQVKNKKTVIDIKPFISLSKVQQVVVGLAVKRYLSFI